MCSSCRRLRSSRCINSRGSRRPSEFPIFLISIFIRKSSFQFGTIAAKVGQSNNPHHQHLGTPWGMLYNRITYPAPPFNKCCTPFLPTPPAPSRLAPIHTPPRPWRELLLCSL